MIITPTGKELRVRILDRDILLFNQHSDEWSHIYNHPVDPCDTLKSAGCGIFSICHAVQWLSGQILEPNELADFSMNNGGRMYDGTNRPALLAALQKSGLAAKYGFSYSASGPENGCDRLYKHIAFGGAALCNLRVGHIVCLVAANEIAGERCLLALDSHPTDRQNSQYDSIRETLKDCDIIYETRNSKGVLTGFCSQAAAFWVDWKAPFDYDLLYPII